MYPPVWLLINNILKKVSKGRLQPMFISDSVKREVLQVPEFHDASCLMHPAHKFYLVQNGRPVKLKHINIFKNN